MEAILSSTKRLMHDAQAEHSKTLQRKYQPLIAYRFSASILMHYLVLYPLALGCPEQY